MPRFFVREKKNFLSKEIPISFGQKVVFFRTKFWACLKWHEWISGEGLSDIQPRSSTGFAWGYRSAGPCGACGLKCFQITKNSVISRHKNRIAINLRR